LDGQQLRGAGDQRLIRIGGFRAAMGNFQYTNANGQGILKLAYPLLVIAPPSPTNVVYARTPVTLTATAYGTNVAGATYQWQWDNGTAGVTWTNITGATSTNYVIGTTNLLGNYEYQVIGTIGGITFTGGPVTITVNAAIPPTIVQDIQPSTTLNLYAGEGVTLSATFTGNQPISYFWQISQDGWTFTDIPGATNTSYTFMSELHENVPLLTR
jgi:hypothetical protein